MQFKDMLNNKAEAINDIIKGFLPAEDTMSCEVEKAMNYSVMAGGKRIRPLIMSEAYKLCGGSEECAAQVLHPFMAALEFIHTYSLVHDDLPAMDNDMYRRGQLTTHAAFGEDMGILAGDALLNYAYETMLRAACDMTDTYRERSIRAASVIAGKAGIYGMVGGQTLDVKLTGMPMNAGQLDYIFRLKTGALIEAAFMAGAILAGAPDEVTAKLEKAGDLVGVAFQIQDDILDVTGDAEVIGKQVLSDEKNNKTTYVTLYGMDKAVSDVAELSNEAVDIICSIGGEGFLTDLVKYMIHRNN